MVKYKYKEMLDGYSDDGEPNWIKIPEEFIIRNENNGLHSLIASIYLILTMKIGHIFVNEGFLHQRMMMSRR